MRKKTMCYWIGFTLLLGVCACAEEEKYATSVVQQVDLFLNNKPWSISAGATTRPLFIYNNDGEYFANYSSHYRFQLPNGTYKIVLTTQTDSIPVGINLNDVVLKQDPTGKAKFAFSVSAPVEYHSPFNEPLTVRMYSRTGVLRLKATDKKADKSYATVRAVLTCPVSAYKLANATYVETPIEVIRDKSTTSGGVNYTDDVVLFETQTIGKEVAVRIDYLDKSNNVVQSKKIDGSFPILANDTTQVEFALNNAEEPMIQDYTVTIASEGWSNEEISPEAPMNIPQGYRYVNPEENLEQICKTMITDQTITAVKLFLKAGEAYKLGRQTELSKAVYIVGQKPMNGQFPASIEMGNMSISTGGEKIDAIHFENLNIKTTDADFFKLKNQKFHVGEISLKNCEVNSLGRTMWYQEANLDYGQVVDHFIIDNCRFLHLNANSNNSGLLGINTKVICPVNNITFKNSTFHILTTGLKNPIITGLTKMTADLSVTIENCTFVRMGPGDMSFFDLTATNAKSLTLVVKNNLFGGVSELGKGQWFKLGNVTNRTFDNNYHTQGFVMATWGVESNEIPTETTAITSLFEDVLGSDLTIKDKRSEVYTKGIGDLHWIR